MVCVASVVLQIKKQKANETRNWSYRIACRMGMSVRTGLEVKSRIGQRATCPCAKTVFGPLIFPCWTAAVPQICTLRLIALALTHSIHFTPMSHTVFLEVEWVRVKRCPVCMYRTTSMAVSTLHCLTPRNWVCNGEAMDPCKISGESYALKRGLGKPSHWQHSVLLLVCWCLIWGFMGDVSPVRAQVSDHSHPSCILTSDD